MRGRSSEWFKAWMWLELLFDYPAEASKFLCLLQSVHTLFGPSSLLFSGCWEHLFGRAAIGTRSWPLPVYCRGWEKVDLYFISPICLPSVHRGSGFISMRGRMVKETGYESVYWIHLAEDRIQCLCEYVDETLVFISCITCWSTRSLLHGITYILCSFLCVSPPLVLCMRWHCLVCLLLNS